MGRLCTPSPTSKKQAPVTGPWQSLIGSVADIDHLGSLVLYYVNIIYYPSNLLVKYAAPSAAHPPALSTHPVPA